MSRVLAILALLALAAAGPAVAAPARHAAGYWTVSAEAPNNCLGRMPIKAAGRELLLLATRGGLAFGVEAETPLPRAKLGVIATEAYEFGFEPTYSESGNFLYTLGDLGAREVAALRLARQVRITVGGQTVLNVGVERTGLDEVMDSLVACSQGQSGWWGKGAEVEVAEAASADDDGPPLNKEGVWALEASPEGPYCVAHAAVGDDRQLQILAAGDQLGLAVGAINGKLPRGRRGRVEIDGFAFDFKPDFEGDSYMASDKPFDSQSLFVLRRATSIRITVDGKALVDASLEGSGFPEILTAAAACAAGEKGWWGEGAKQG